MKNSFREHHLYQALKLFENQHLPLDLFLNHYFKSHRALGSKDRGFLAESIYGMTRWRSLLDHLAGDKKSWERRYAVYQAFQPNQYLQANHLPLHVRVSFPENLFSLMLDQYGEEKATKLCQILNTPAPTTVRANPLKTTRDALLQRWKGEYDVVPCTTSPLGITFKKRVPLFASPEFKEGLFEMQDEGSQLIADLVQAKPGDQVLDYCAGSGGKTLAFAHRLEEQGQIYLHDVRPYALEQGRKRLKRAGIQNAQFMPAGTPSLSKLKKKMDWVLVDAPCSGTGTLRRNPDMKWRFSNEMLTRLVGEQRMIFERGLSYLKEGGYIVYVTCSLLRKENEEQVDHFLKTYPITLVGAPMVTLPTYGGPDGFYGAVFKKVGGGSESCGGGESNR